jgi:NAD(P)-dependent dehydrogenase (short-subunit alcohol dehydrogenase family)
VVDEFRLEGKTALVTGAGRGIGRAIALVLAQAGADIAAVARSKDQVEDTAREVRSLSRQALALSVDATRSDQVNAAVEKVMAEFNKVDILVNNAGALIMKPLVCQPGIKSRFTELLPDFTSPTTEEDWYSQIDTNAKSVFLFSLAVGPHMIRQRKGKVINIVSADIFKSEPNHIIYTASKGAVAAFTRSLAAEWARYNINVNAIAPGYFRTSLTDFAYEDEHISKGMLRLIPLGRFGNLRELGLAALFLASGGADFITGQIIVVDGGLTL